MSHLNRLSNNDVGAISKIIYPDGKEYNINFDNTTKDGRISNIYFNNKLILNNIELFNENSNIIKSYINGAGIKTTIDVDALTGFKDFF
jgi:hypothetical protein